MVYNNRKYYILHEYCGNYCFSSNILECNQPQLNKLNHLTCVFLNMFTKKVTIQIKKTSVKYR